MWLFDKLMNRKIEGKSSLDNVEPLLEKVEVSDDVVKLPDGTKVSIENEEGGEVNVSPSEVSVKSVFDDDGEVVGSTEVSGEGVKYHYTDESGESVYEAGVSLGDIDTDGHPYVEVYDDEKSASLKAGGIEFTDGDDGGSLYYDKTDDKLKSLVGIQGKTLYQTHPTWDAGDITILSHGGGADYDAVVTYGKAVLVGNSLEIVIIVKCTNNGESSVLHPHVEFSELTLPDYIAEKVYDMDGKNLRETALTVGCPISPSTRGAYGKLASWTSRFNELTNINGKIIRGSALNKINILAREGLPTLGAGEIGYSLIAFELVII